jgi:hypothetical protein
MTPSWPKEGRIEDGKVGRKGRRKKERGERRVMEKGDVDRKGRYVWMNRGSAWMRVDKIFDKNCHYF